MQTNASALHYPVAVSLFSQTSLVYRIFYNLQVFIEILTIIEPFTFAWYNDKRYDPKYHNWNICLIEKHKGDKSHV